MISLLTFIPLIVASLILATPRRRVQQIKLYTLMGGLAALAPALTLLWQFDPGAGLQFVERHSWMPSIGVDYHVGLDGWNALVVMLAVLLVPVSAIASWGVTGARAKPYFFFLNLLFTGVYGVFTALNFFHWFLYWEFVLVPAFFLIKLFGEPGKDGGPHRTAMTFLLFTVLGSAATLIGFLLLYQKAGTFDFVELADLARSGDLPGALGDAYIPVFFLVMLGLWVKVPLVPLHLWQPGTYTRAPAPVTLLLTALLSKMGVYGFLRLVVPVFPEAMAAHADHLLTFALLTVWLGAFAAMRQDDLKRLLAYSSMNHVAYCLLGIFAAGAAGNVLATAAATAPPDSRVLALQGAVLQMFAHGLSAAGLFFLVGRLQARTGTRSLGDFGGLGAGMPRFAAAFGILAMASLGLPFLAGFSAEFLIFSGAFPRAPGYTAAAALGLLATAVFLLTVLQRLFTGPPPPKHETPPDLNWAEALCVVPLIIFVVWAGVDPGSFLELSDATVSRFVGGE